ncbi:MAG: ABC transporter permease [Bdellovibrio sp. CG10_big_fil_rev_8_21_14_0_10_47_8]|nr:MAG: ABC transporter permease [Bdellovibrio sp. CG10_big_fil_rev_8_21_14_0_10_47_8]
MRSLIGLFVGLAISLSIVAFAGENPFSVFMILIRSAFGSPYDLGLALFYTTSLIFTGLSVSLAFQAGLFNIGAEGQLTVAALAAAATGVLLPEVPSPWAPLLATTLGISAGALWGFIPGWLKSRRGSHEVIVTMMMNFIAAALASYVVLDLIKNPESQNPESKILGPGYLLKDYDFVQKFFVDSPANLSLILALALSVLIYFFLYKTIWGYELRASGQNEVASEMAGISSKRWKTLAMTIAGALAGFVCVNEILGSSGRYKIGFSPEYGFVGIAVALLARSHPLGVIASAFLFGALQKGASDLDIETATITKDFARIIQAILIFSVAGATLIDFSWIRQKCFFWKKKGVTDANFE